MDQKVEMIERFKFDALRLANVKALKHATTLLMHAETGNFIGKHEEYDELLKLVRALAVGLDDGVGF